MPNPPYIIFGTVYESDGVTPSNSAALTLVNDTTGETLTTTANANGQYAFDCANLASDYTDGDYVRITVSGSGSNGQNLKIKIISKGVGQIDELNVDYG